MLIEATTEIATRVTNAIRDAARATGASFDYLLKTALRESGLDPSAKASTSSATGLFQFVDQTWLETVKTAGPSLGYARQAEAIERTASGRYVVSDPAQRREIMNLRNDPAASASMAAAFTQRNAAALTARLGRKPTEGELYIAHFLGTSGAGNLIGTAQSSPRTRAADLFPEAARANRSIFYNRNGSARSVGQVYGHLVAKHDATRTPALADVTQVAAATQPVAARVSAVAGIPSAPAAVAALTRTMPIKAVASDSPPVVPLSFASAEGSGFHGLFHTGRSGPVAAVVSELWGAKAAAAPQAERVVPRVERAVGAPAAVPAGAVTRAKPAAGRPLQLFEFLRPDIRERGGESA